MPSSLRIERGPVAGEIGLGDIQKAVAVVIGDRDAHAGLQLAVGVVSYAGRIAALFESAVVLVEIQQAGSLIAGHIEVGPAIVIEVRSHRAEAVTAARARECRLSRRRR